MRVFPNLASGLAWSGVFVGVFCGFATFASMMNGGEET